MPADLPLPPLDEPPDEERDVLPALAQGRDADREDVQPVVEVGPEAARLDGGLEVVVGGGDEADVDLPRLARADPLELSLLEDAEELRLEVEAEVPDLVEEEGAAVGELETADLRGDRRR